MQYSAAGLRWKGRGSGVTGVVVYDGLRQRGTNPMDRLPSSKSLSSLSFAFGSVLTSSNLFCPFHFSLSSLNLGIRHLGLCIGYNDLSIIEFYLAQLS
ncbi:hypothetical protein HanHA300_Chr01g0018351 [Helianthus annuus]|nr:hypothetical protein HanHA300_Chr01g0018351 [Helianthus annuus]